MFCDNPKACENIYWLFVDGTSFMLTTDPPTKWCHSAPPTLRCLQSDVIVPPPTLRCLQSDVIVPPHSDMHTKWCHSPPPHSESLQSDVIVPPPHSEMPTKWCHSAPPPHSIKTEDVKMRFMRKKCHVVWDFGNRWKVLVKGRRNEWRGFGLNRFERFWCRYIFYISRNKPQIVEQNSMFFLLQHKFKLMHLHIE